MLLCFLFLPVPNSYSFRSYCCFLVANSCYILLLLLFARSKFVLTLLLLVFVSSNFVLRLLLLLFASSSFVLMFTVVSVCQSLLCVTVY